MSSGRSKTRSGIPCFHEDAEASKTQPDDDRKKQRDSDKSEDREDHIREWRYPVAVRSQVTCVS